MPRLNTRVTAGIFSNDTVAAEDADVIMTCAVLGFSIKLLSEHKPVRFDTEGIHAGMTEAERATARADIAAMARTVASLNQVIEHVGIPGRVAHGTSPAYDYANKTVSGVEAGDRLEYFHRNVETAFVGESQELHDLAVHDPTVSYQGRGAYTGLVVSPEGGGKPMIASTYASIVPDRDDYGERWHPAGPMPSLGTGPAQKTWGMIGDNRTQKQLQNEGMGFVPETLGRAIEAWTPPAPWSGTQPETDLIGYTHGMIQAIVKCYIRQRDGSRPFEIAVGPYTTKLASCFCCTLFMHAAEFPPSSTHLDRGESWVPMYGAHFSLPVAAVEETNQRWYGFCTEVLLTGLSALRQSMSRVRESHHHSVRAMHAFIAEHTAPTSCANLILDAMTVQDKERARIDRTLR